MPDPVRLHVLPPSHYCERARWALDLAGIPYQEVPHPVVLHVPRIRKLARSSQLPVLETSEAVIQGSGSILDWAGTPGGDAEIEERFEHRVGVLARRLIYAAALSDPRSGLRELLASGLEARDRRVAQLAWPVSRQVMATAMKARPALLPELTDRLEAEIAWFDGVLAARGRSPERPHLVGDRIGRADITAASLLAPLARPGVVPLYRDFQPPERLGRILERWWERPALAWTEGLYAEHRAFGAARV